MTADSPAAAVFDDPRAISDYASRTARLVPGLHDMHRMAMILLAERTPPDAQVLVVGAGGGLELELFARSNPRWRFIAVDPSAPMLSQAKERLGDDRSRVTWHEGYVADSDVGPHDAAVCLLTLHFLAREERLSTLREVRRRLRPGAPFVMAHLSFPREEPQANVWLSRYAAFAMSSGVAPENARNAAATIGEQLTILSPANEETMLREAGFVDAATFYVGLAFRGWVAIAGDSTGSRPGAYL
jgi:tRNA (cmo5U34)-methyltransferase